MINLDSVEVYFLGIYITLPIIIYLLLRLAGESINRVSVVTIVVIALYVFSVVGTLPLFYGWDEYRVSIGVTDSAQVLEVLLFSSVNIIFFLIGIIVLREVTGWRPIIIDSSEIRDLRAIHKILMSITFVVCVIVLFAYLTRIDEIAILVAIKDGADRAAVVRSDMGNNFQGKYHWYKLIMKDIGLVLLYSLYVNWIRQKRLIGFLVLLTLLLYSSFVAVMATEKAPFVWLIVGMFIAHFLATSNGRVPLHKFSVIGLVLVAISAVLYLYLTNSKDIQSALASVLSRSLSGSIMPAYFYLEYIPGYRDYLMGSTFPNPGQIFPYVPIRFTVEIMHWKFPHLIDKGIVGSMPTVFWGESYVNFGSLAIPVIAFVMGVQVAIVSYLITKVNQNPLTIGFLVWLMLEFMNLSVTGFSEFIFNFYVFGVGGIVLTILLSPGKVSIRRRVSRWTS